MEIPSRHPAGEGDGAPAPRVGTGPCSFVWRATPPAGHPLTDARRARLPGLSPTRKDETGAMTKLRVLVIESVPQLQPALVAVLGAGAVVASSSAILALEQAREGPTAAIVRLPVLDCSLVLVVRA